MDVALKIWRFDAESGERELRDYQVEAPEWACLLDVLDIVKDQVDGTLSFRKSCRMMICGSCGMRMDGRAVLACKERMLPIVEAGHVPVISAMGNLPIVKDLVVDMGPFWQKMRAMKPWLEPGYLEAPEEKEFHVSPAETEVIHKEALCINCGCCVSECNSMESDPEFLGPAALAKGMRFVGDSRDQGTVERLEEYNADHGIWDCTRCYFCTERCPKGVDPRDAIAKLGAESIKHGIDRDMGAKHANWFVHSAKTTGWLRETELVPKTQGVVSSIKEMKFAMSLARKGKVPLPFPPHVAENVKQARDLYNLVKEQGRDGAAGIVQGEKGIAYIEFAEDQEKKDRGERQMKVAYYKGCLASLSAKELDTSTQALAPKLGLELDELESVTCCGAGDIHEAEPDYYLHLNARILAYGEATGADTLMTICNVCTLNLRQANWQLKNDDALRARVNENLERVGVPAVSGGDVEVKHFLWLIAEGEGYELLKQVAHKGLKGLKIAPFYGCQILRPSKILGFEDPDRPWSLERIITACGGEPIDYPAKIKCCGFPIIQAREETALGELIQPIEQAMEAGADAMVTPCPLCHLSLDAWQQKLEAVDRQEVRPADHPPLAARSASPPGFDGVGAEVQAARRPGRRRSSRSSRSDARTRRHGPCRGRRGRDRRRRLGAVRGRLGAAGASSTVRAAGAPAGARRAADRASLRLPPRRPVAGGAGGRARGRLGGRAAARPRAASPATCSSRARRRGAAPRR